jgi:hypothetical protein
LQRRVRALLGASFPMANTTTSVNQSHRQIIGEIRADAAYSVREFRARMSLGSHAWRLIRPKLRIIKVGKKLYIRGADWLAFLDQLASEQGGDAATTDSPEAARE